MQKIESDVDYKYLCEFKQRYIDIQNVYIESLKNRLSLLTKFNALMSILLIINFIIACIEGRIF